LVQEALTNVVKYAKAGEVVVTLAPVEGGGARVAVKDDGVGFDTNAPRLARHGLIGMRYRVEAEGGTMQLVSSPGAGTLIEATLPAPRPGHPGATGENEDVALPAAA
jgi:signal transduction histidine kinase